MFFSNGLPQSNIKHAVFSVLPTPFLKKNKISLDSLTLPHIVLWGEGDEISLIFCHALPVFNPLALEMDI